MKKILFFVFIGLFLTNCSTTATSDNGTPTDNINTSSDASNTSNTGSTNDTDNSSNQDNQSQVAHQQILAFEANQVKMYTHPVDN